jgi:hypothetical protein
MKTMINCRECGGSGKNILQHNGPCSVCNGTGKVEKDDSWYDEEARSITKCCGNYMDRNEAGQSICRSCKKPVGWQGDGVYPLPQYRSIDDPVET